MPSVSDVYRAAGSEALEAVEKLSALTGVPMEELLSHDTHKLSPVPFSIGKHPPFLCPSKCGDVEVH
jgi:hypothetical protein